LRCWCSLKGADVHGGIAKAECGEQRFHDDRRARNDKATDNGEFAGIGVASPNGETAANDANGPKDKGDEHDDAHGRTGPLCEATRSRLGEEGSE